MPDNGDKSIDVNFEHPDNRLYKFVTPVMPDNGDKSIDVNP